MASVGGAVAKDGAASAAGTAAAAVLERDLVTTRPEYNFEYKVADDFEQTYIFSLLWAVGGYLENAERWNE